MGLPLHSIAAAALADLERDQHRSNPVAWADHHGLELWSAQRKIAASVAAGTRQIAIPSGHGTGKSALFARILGWAGATARGDDTLVAIVSPTAAQLANVMRPARELHRQLDLPGYITRGPVPIWTVDGREIAMGRSVSDTSLATLVGQHALRLIVLVDEADGISAPVWEQIMSLTTGQHNQLIAAGNPRNPSSRWRALVDGGGWDVHRISVLDTPAFTGEKVSDELLAVLPSKQWVEDRRRDYGEGSPLWMGRVEGLWPPDGEYVVIAGSVFDGAVNGPTGETAYGDDMPLWILDVARSGVDRTVFAKIEHRRYAIDHVVVGQDTTTTSTQAAARLNAHPGARIVIDGDGIGGGVIDNLRAAGLGGRVLEYRGSERAGLMPHRYTNLRAEAHWLTARLLEGKDLYGRPARPIAINADQGVHPALTDGASALDQLREEAIAVSYQQNASGLIVLEKKEDVHRRIGRSPDLSDTLVMGCWALTGGLRPPREPKGTGKRRRRRRKGIAAGVLTEAT